MSTKALDEILHHVVNILLDVLTRPTQRGGAGRSITSRCLFITSSYSRSCLLTSKLCALDFFLSVGNGT